MSCCNRKTEFHCITKKSFFCIFFIPILPLKVESEYWECNSCREVFKPEDLRQASYIPVIKTVLSYLLTGYGFSEHWSSACEVFEAICGEALDKDEIIKISDSYNTKEEFFEVLKKQAFNLEISGGIKIIQVAYLFSLMVGEVQFDERFRINLIGSAINIDISSINEIIVQLKQNNHLGIKPEQQYLGAE